MAQQPVTPGNPEAPRRTAVSVVVPVYGNDATLCELTDRIIAAVPDQRRQLEIVFVDDASPDRAWETITTLAGSVEGVHGVRLAENCGALTAIAVGCSSARGDQVCSIDADLENRPEDLVALLDALDSGYDLVSAVRVDQSGRPLLRRVASIMTRVAVAGVWDFWPRDFGCGMKAWESGLAHVANQRIEERRDVAWAVDLFSASRSYGEVATSWVDQDRRSAYTLLRKAKQAAILLAVLRPRAGPVTMGLTVALCAASALAAVRRVYRPAAVLFAVSIPPAWAARALRRAIPQGSSSLPALIVAERVGSGWVTDPAGRS